MKYNYESYDKEFAPFARKWGRFTNTVGIILSLIPALTLTFVLGVKPSVEVVISGMIMVFSFETAFYFVEPITYYQILGLPGVYMGFLSGNISNLRLPVSTVCQSVAEVESGTKEGTLIATIGAGVSVFVSELILTFGIVAGATIIANLPANVVSALNNLVPAIFGAIMGQQVIKNTKIAIFAIILSGIVVLMANNGLFAWIPGKYSANIVIMIVSVFGTMLFGKLTAGRQQA